jgi:hypothetical protein
MVRRLIFHNVNTGPTQYQGKLSRFNIYRIFGHRYTSCVDGYKVDLSSHNMDS